MKEEFWVNCFYDQNGDLFGGPSHADYDVAVEYADEGQNYQYSIHHLDAKVEIIDLTDAIREHYVEVALERRHELSFAGAL
jgi:hypothetical protein